MKGRPGWTAVDTSCSGTGLGGCTTTSGSNWAARQLGGPEGANADADVRRLAVHVEDHPVEYFDFEGIIGAGQYGGGDVIVWDWGRWTPALDRGDPARGLADGSLHVDLDGVKLRGRFALARTGLTGAKEQWLLIHKHDEHAVAGWDAEDHPRSVRPAAQTKRSWRTMSCTVPVPG